jgi:post-segregation antitoxin (ccd killing protein)
MTGKKIIKRDTKDARLPVSAGTFPALRQFLRGYLHEDWQEDHDSPAEAAQQFCEDASTGEREDVAREWEAFRQRTKNLSLPAISALLSNHLGAAWRPETADQLDAVSAVFGPFGRKM